MDYIEKIVWHEVTTRPPTEEEIALCERWTGNILDTVYDCPMPEYYDEILICYGEGRVYVDTCIKNEYGMGLEIHRNWGDVLAWAEMPTGKGDEADG